MPPRRAGAPVAIAASSASAPRAVGFYSIQGWGLQLRFWKGKNDKILMPRKGYLKMEEVNSQYIKLLSMMSRAQSLTPFPLFMSELRCECESPVIRLWTACRNPSRTACKE